jgi:CMP-N-acetylneuraminic acid synthetase
MSHLVTVYVPSRNYGQFLGDAVESVFRQTMADWEMLIVDDGSTDDTMEVMSRYEHHPQVRVFQTGGIGLPAVCNFALSHAAGRYIMRLDGDDVLDENALLVLTNVLNTQPEVGLVFPDYYLIDEFGEVYARESRRRLYFDDHVQDMPPNGACTLIRTDVMAEAGGYREDLGAQDGVDIWTKIRTRYKCANVGLPLFYYRQHGSSLTRNTQRITMARQQIKRDATASALKDSRPVIAAIPCRKHYDFQADLWKSEINGRSLLARDISTCLQSEMIDYVVVTCDNPEAAEVAASFSDPRVRFVDRDARSTIRTASIVPTLERICDLYDPERRGMTVLRYIQTPFVTTGTVEEAITTLLLSDADSSYGVEEIRSQVFVRNAHGLQSLNGRSLGPSNTVVYREARSCIATRNRNFGKGTLTGASVASFITSPTECFFIDSERDLAIARKIAGDYAVSK